MSMSECREKFHSHNFVDSMVFARFLKTVIEDKATNKMTYETTAETSFVAAVERD